MCSVSSVCTFTDLSAIPLPADSRKAKVRWLNQNPACVSKRGFFFEDAGILGSLAPPNSCHRDYLVIIQ
jgi:hypothetical protein